MKLDFYRNLCYNAFDQKSLSFSTVQVLLAKLDKVLYVVFRATDCEADWKTHFLECSLGMVRVTTVNDRRVKVHQGWASDFYGSLTYLKMAMDKIISQGDVDSVCFVGHSYGGASASAAALEMADGLKSTGYGVSLVTFNAPLMGNWAFVHNLHERVPNAKHFIYGADVISSLPPWFLGYRHYKNTVHVKKHSWGYVLKNTWTVGWECIKAFILHKEFDYFLFVYAMDHMLALFDGEMEVDA